MYKWVVRRVVRRALSSLSAGDPEPQISSYSSDSVLVFPGRSSWAGRYRGREEIAQFLRRFAAVGLAGHPDVILVNGPPWRTRVCLVMTVVAHDRAGEVVYHNRAAIYAVARWGKVFAQEDFEDTHKSVEFDRYLASKG